MNSVFPRNFNQTLPNVSHGEGIYLFDEKGEKYIDAASGALSVSIGYGVPEVVDAIAKQTAAVPFAHGSAWNNEISEKAATKVLETAPSGMDRVWFVNSGSEAVEAAIKMARQFYLERDGISSSKHMIVGRQNSYHGSSLGTLSVGGSVPRRKYYTPMFLDNPKIETHYCYRCPYGLTKPDCDFVCARDLEKTIRRVGPQYIAAFIAEPIGGSTVGALVPPDEYWPIVRDICSRYDILLIADEVMSGCGRTGANFCVDHWNVVPDLITTAKGIASCYYPVGAVIVSHEVGEAYRKGTGAFAHSHTYNGMPAASAAVVEVMTYMQKHNLVGNAARMGHIIEKELVPSLLDNPVVGEVRGKGLMWGVEIVKDKETREPFPEDVKASFKLKALCMKRKMTTYPGRGMVDGVLGDNIMVGPPLIVTESQLREIFAIFQDGLKELAAMLLK